MNVAGIMHVNVNCSDYERSREFYARLGFRVVWEVPEIGSPEVSAAVGMPPYRFVCFKDPDGTVLELVEMSS